MSGFEIGPAQGDYRETRVMVSGAPSQDIHQQQDRDRNTEEPKQNPPDFPVIGATHGDPPFLSTLELFLMYFAISGNRRA